MTQPLSKLGERHGRRAASPFRKSRKHLIPLAVIDDRIFLNRSEATSRPAIPRLVNKVPASTHRLYPSFR